MNATTRFLMWKRCLSASLAVSLLTLVGCGGPGYSAAPVSGKVTINGKPAENIFVQFQPQGGGEEAPSSTAVTDAQGRFTLTIAQPGGSPGAVPGEHSVRFAPRGDSSDGPPTKRRARPALPAKATDGSLRFTVPAEGTDAANFDL